MLEFFYPGFIIVTAGFFAIFLFTKKGSRARAWVTATPNRIASVGIVILILLWAGVLIHNESARNDNQVKSTQ